MHFHVWTYCRYISPCKYGYLNPSLSLDIEQPPGFVSDAVVVCVLVIVVIISMVVLSLCGLALWTK